MGDSSICEVLTLLEIFCYPTSSSLVGERGGYLNQTRVGDLRSIDVNGLEWEYIMDLEYTTYLQRLVDFFFFFYRCG